MCEIKVEKLSPVSSHKIKFIPIPNTHLLIISLMGQIIRSHNNNKISVKQVMATNYTLIV